MLGTKRDFDDPSATQLSVFLPNRIGQLRDLLRELDQAGLELQALSVLDSSDFAIVRLVVDKAETARLALERRGLPVSCGRILIVDLPDETKGLQKLCQCLIRGEVNIHHVYPLLRRPHGVAAVVVHAEDVPLAAELLQKDEFRLVADEELAGG